MSPWYGITLTFALVRGFADLGPAMTNTHLVFLNADFIIADGSLDTLAGVIKRGARLVVSPSYCMNLEDTIDNLRRRRNQTTGALALPKRELAGIIIANRHNTVRAKTVNQRLFRIHRYDQFYWYVDDETLLARQMPIAVVYMRPERVLTEMPTFWDYGVISEYCPTAAPCVLGDSDEFLMAELRSRGTFRELLHLGWPSIDEIAADLSSFTTQDHRDYGRHTLILHSASLPPGIGAAKAELAAVVDSVYARLKPPISYHNHPFWGPQFPQFLRHQQQRLCDLHAAEAAATDLVARDSRAASREQQIAELSARIRKLEAKIHATERRLAEGRAAAAGKLAALDAECRAHREAIEREAQSLMAGNKAITERLQRIVALIEERRARLRQQQERAVQAHLAAAAPGRARPNGSIAAVAKLEPDNGGGGRGLGHQLRTAIGKAAITLSGRVYRRTFGSLPRTTPLHPFHAMLRPALAALCDSGSPARVLVVSSGGALSAALLQGVEGNKLAVTPNLLDSEFTRISLRGGTKFDLCFCDLTADDLGNFRPTLELIRPLLAANASIVVTHRNLGGRPIDERTYEFAGGLFPLFGRSRIAFAGSYPGALSARWFARALERHNAALPKGLVALAATLALCAPLAWLGSGLERRREAQHLPKHCTSMTFVIDLP